MSNKVVFSVLILGLFVGFGYYNYKKNKDEKSTILEVGFSEFDLKIKNPYAFATTLEAKTAAAFMKIENPNLKNEKLVEAWSDIAEFTEVHQNYIDPDDGTMMMRKIKTLDIPTKGNALLEPTSYHIMFINLKKKLNVGDTFPLTLVFQNNGEQEVNVTVVAPGTKPKTAPEQ